jgi:hypothetical protein
MTFEECEEKFGNGWPEFYKRSLRAIFVVAGN